MFVSKLRKKRPITRKEENIQLKLMYINYAKLLEVNKKTKKQTVLSKRKREL